LPFFYKFSNLLIGSDVKTKFVSKGGSTMAKTFLWVLVIIVFTPCIAFAQRDVRLEIEGRYWFTNLKGNVNVTQNEVGTDIDFKRDLDIKDANYWENRITWYTGPKSKIRIGYTQVNYEGDQTLTKTVQFNGQAYNVGTRVVTDFDIKYLRIGWAWQFINIDNGFFKLGTLIEGKGFWTKTTLEAPDLIPSLREKKRFVFALPTIGAALDINPHKDLEHRGGV
jgi:hypothetical protein